ncbi:CRISPR-associated endoribonuclease Cas6 [Desulfurobacterium sp.]
MPVKLGLILHLEKPIKIKEVYPKRVHALFFSILPEDISEKIHSQKSTKPFTICFEKFFRENGENEVSKLKLKVTLLDDFLFPYFSQGVILGEKKLYMGSTAIRKKEILSIEHKSYEDLIGNTEENRDFLFYFKTPTTFKKGSSDYPLPEPVLIFKNLLKKWNKFSPFKIEISTKELLKLLQIGGVWIKTRKFSLLPNGKTIGFYGRVFINVRTEKKETLRKLNILFNFSSFSGIGRKTTMGMGNVELSSSTFQDTNGKRLED